MASKNENNQTKKKRFKIEDIPETTRKRIFIVAVTLIMLIIITSWLYSLKISLTFLKKTDNQTRGWQILQGDLTNFLNNFKKDLESTKKQLDQIAQPTTTPELSPADLEKVKEKLLELEQKN